MTCLKLSTVHSQVKRRLKNWMKSPQNFERLVLGCMDSYDSDQRLILQGFSRSTRFTFLCTAQTSKFQQKSVKLFAIMKNEISFFSIFSRFFRWVLSFFCQISMNFSRNFADNLRKWQNLSIFWQKPQMFWKKLWTILDLLTFFIPFEWKFQLHP